MCFAGLVSRLGIVLTTSLTALVELARMKEEKLNRNLDL